MGNEKCCDKVKVAGRIEGATDECVDFYRNKKAFELVYKRSLDEAIALFSKKKFEGDTYWKNFFTLKAVVDLMFSKSRVNFRLMEICSKRKYFEGQFQYYSDKRNIGAHPENSLIVGTMYYFGIGTEVNIALARKYLLRAGKKGSGMALFLLAFCKKRNIGKTNAVFLASRMSNRSMNYLFKSCEFNFNKAFLIAGTLYSRGLNGKVIDFHKAIKYSEKFALSGDGMGLFLHGYNLMQVAKTPQERRDAFGWIQKAYEAGSKRATYRLATCYMYGFGCQKDIEKCIQILTRDLEDVSLYRRVHEIKNRLTLHFAYSDSKQMDLMADNDEKLIKALEEEKAATQEVSVNLELAFATCYQYGIGVNKNIKKAMQIYDRLTKYDKGAILRKISLITSEIKVLNEEFSANKVQIEQYNLLLEKTLQKGVKLGSVKCLYNLAELYNDKKDENRAVEFWKQAAAKGHSYANYKLGNYYFQKNRHTKWADRNAEYYSTMNRAKQYLERAITLGCKEAQAVLTLVEAHFNNDSASEIKKFFRTLNNSFDNTVKINKIIEDELTSKLGQSILSIGQDEKVTLITSTYIFYHLNEMFKNHISADFAPVITLHSKVIENTVKNTFYLPFIKYVRARNIPLDNFSATNPIMDKRTMGKKQRKLIDEKHADFTLGSFKYLIERQNSRILNSDDALLLDKDINNGFFDISTSEGTFYWFFNKHFIDFCQECIYKEKGEEARELIMRRIDDIFRLLNGFKYSRNITTHSKPGTFYDAVSAYNLTIVKEKLLSLLLSKTV